ncbi:MAG: hypothetical protein P8Y00_04320, partial [Deltaproteobacteria bacterium]
NPCLKRKKRNKENACEGLLPGLQRIPGLNGIVAAAGSGNHRKRKPKRLQRALESSGKKTPGASGHLIL